MGEEAFPNSGGGIFEIDEGPLFKKALYLARLESAHMQRGRSYLPLAGRSSRSGRSLRGDPAVGDEGHSRGGSRTVVLDVNGANP